MGLDLPSRFGVVVGSVDQLFMTVELDCGREWQLWAVVGGKTGALRIFNFN